jgi:hypothetical protein
MLNTPGKRLAALVGWLALIWASAIWTVIQKSQQFRFPVVVASAVWFGALSLMFTYYGIRIYLATEKDQRRE